MSIEQCQPNLGCILEEPSEKDYNYELIAGSTGEIAEIDVPVPKIYNQGAIDACVGMAIAGQESVQNGVVVSPRIIWAGAKKMDNYQGWGTSIKNGFESLKKEKTLPFGDIDESVTMSRDKYMRVNLTHEQQEKAKKHSIQSYWSIFNAPQNMHLIYDALKKGATLVTSMMWYNSYNNPINGFLPAPDYPVGGHCFQNSRIQVRGGEMCLGFPNSWGEKWGEGGFFYIPIRELQSRGVGSFWLTQDITSDRAKIINKYQNCLVKNENSPKVYFVSGNEIAWIKDEPMFHYGRGIARRWWGNWGDVLVEREIPITEDITFNFS